MKKILNQLSEFWLVVSNQVPSYIPNGKRKEWLKQQKEEFIPLFVEQKDKELWNKTIEKCAKEGNLLKLLLAKGNWKVFA